MTIDTKEMHSILNDLVQTCKDGQQGFLDAAHHVKNMSLKSMFRELSQQRSTFAGELQQEVTRSGGEPEKKGTTTGALHRGWVDFKSRITGQSDASVIKETEQSEDTTVKAYEKALEEDLPGDIRDIVARQYNAVLQTHARVRALELRTNGSGA
jgi:uncharacterized protein (TIGR02284 family)